MSELLKEFKQYLRENEESYKNGARDSIEYPLGYEEVKLLLNEIERLNKDLDTAIDICNKRQVEIVRLNNIINKGIEAINVYQNEKTLSVGYEDLKRIRRILRGNEFDLQMFEEYLQELKGEDIK